jgi:hypothetical protein
VRFWRGISQGHWDGNTLVVESSNIKSIPQATRWPLFPNTMSDENLRVTERFTRTAADTIMYQATITDPTVYVKPWLNTHVSVQGPFLGAARGKLVRSVGLGREKVDIGHTRRRNAAQS